MLQKVFAKLVSGFLLAGLARTAVLHDFQVAEPASMPKNTETCTTMILERTFGNSYGNPEIVQYAPPSNCGAAGSWAGVSLNFTVTSNGTQYDRLAVFTFQNTEIWRTSTAEPTTGGIIWTYTKDVTRYIPLFAKPGTLILELDNILGTGLTGQYATTLYATFYAASAVVPTAPQANTIIPISTLSNTSANDASVPPTFSLNVTLPRNTVQIFAELYASGNSAEEFWYNNAADEYINYLPPQTTYGGGPFREVRILVDGQVAGVAFPYPVIFTGGINPACWRPITSYGALDLPTYFLDLTPFVPVFVDGLPHTISLDVASAEVKHTLNQNWFVSGLLQVITDSSSQPTTGNITSYVAQPYAATEITGSVDGGDVNITVNAYRQIKIEATIISGSGKANKVVWEQNLEYSNTQYYLNNASTQNVVQNATGYMLSTHNGIPTLSDQFSYPLNINFSYLNPNGTAFYTSIDHSYTRNVLPAPFILGSTIVEHQVASGYFEQSSNGNQGNGTNNNTFTYTDTKANTFYWDVNAAYNNITYNEQGGSLATSSLPNFPGIYKAVSLPAARLPGGKVVGVPSW